MTISRMTHNKMTICKMTLSKLSIMTLSKMTLSKMTFSKMTFGKMTFRKMPLSKMTISKMTICKMTHSKMPISWMTLSMKTNNATFTIMILDANAECHRQVMLSVFLQSVVTPRVTASRKRSFPGRENFGVKVSSTCLSTKYLNSSKIWTHFKR